MCPIHSRRGSLPGPCRSPGPLAGSSLHPVPAPARPAQPGLRRPLGPTVPAADGEYPLPVQRRQKPRWQRPVERRAEAGHRDLHLPEDGSGCRDQESAEKRLRTAGRHRARAALSPSAARALGCPPGMPPRSQQPARGQALVRGGSWRDRLWAAWQKPGWAPNATIHSGIYLQLT